MSNPSKLLAQLQAQAQKQADELARQQDEIAKLQRQLGATTADVDADADTDDAADDDAAEEVDLEQLAIEKLSAFAEGGEDDGDGVEDVETILAQLDAKRDKPPGNWSNPTVEQDPQLTELEREVREPLRAF